LINLQKHIRFSKATLLYTSQYDYYELLPNYFYTGKCTVKKCSQLNKKYCIRIFRLIKNKEPAIIGRYVFPSFLNKLYNLNTMNWQRVNSLLGELINIYQSKYYANSLNFILMGENN